MQFYRCNIAMRAGLINPDTEKINKLHKKKSNQLKKLLLNEYADQVHRSMTRARRTAQRRAAAASPLQNIPSETL